MFWGCSQNLIFIHNVLCNLSFLDITAIQDLNCIYFFCFLVVTSIDLPKVSGAQLFYDMKIAQDHFFLLFLSWNWLLDWFWNLRFLISSLSLKVDVDFSYISLIDSEYIFRDDKLFVSHQLAELNDGIRLINDSLPLQFST